MLESDASLWLQTDLKMVIIKLRLQSHDCPRGGTCSALKYCIFHRGKILVLRRRTCSSPLTNQCAGAQVLGRRIRFYDSGSAQFGISEKARSCACMSMHDDSALTSSGMP